MLLNGIVYQHGRKVAELDNLDALRDCFVMPDSFVWIGLKDATPEELALVKEKFNLHDLAIEDAVKGQQRPKVEEYGDDLFAVIHLVEEVEGKLHIGEISIFVGNNYIVSVRNNSQQSLLGVRARCEREPRMLNKGPGYVFYALMDTIVDNYFPFIETLESELERLEERIFTKGAARNNIYRLYRLKRKVTKLRHAVVPLLDAAGKLQSGRPPPLCNNTKTYFRDVYDHLTRINASLDSIRDTLGTAIQVNLSMVTIDQSEVGKKLAAWAGIFAIATAFAGIWGMNFTHMPELQLKYGYPAALLIITSLCGFLYWRFKKANWL